MTRRPATRTNLPVERGAFVGRAKVLDEAAAAFGAGARLLVLVGPEGIGKTRLALRVAARELPRVAAAGPPTGAVIVVDCADVVDAPGLVRAIAEALELEPQAAPTPEAALDRLVRSLPAQGPLLLVLDGVDGCRDAAAAVAARALAEAPDARLLVTSRKPLGAADEKDVVVPPLKMPKQGAATAFEHGGVQATEAVELFLERAKEARRGYQPDARELSSIAKIVRLLEGVPLAIEIAAARMRALTAEELLERLPRNVSLLGAGGTASITQRSALAGAVAWSLDLLQRWELAALAQCGVFRGGFDLEAARAVLDVSPFPDAPSIDAVVESLREKSLLRVDEPRAFPGEARFSPPNVVRETAERALDQRRDRDAVEKRHAAHYLARGGAWAEGVDGHGGLALRRRLELESDNLLATVRRALSAEPGTLVSVTWALRGMLALEPVLLMRGPHDVLEELLDRALGPAEAVGAPFALRARVLELRARVRRLRGRMHESLADLQQAQALAKQARDPALEGRVRGNVGTHRLYEGDLAAARADYEAALALLQQGGDRRIAGRCLGYMALLARESGKPDDARGLYEEAIRVHKEVGDRRYEAIDTGQLGKTLFVLGRIDEARACLKRALAIHREQGDKKNEGIVLGWLGDLAFELGSLDEARVHHDAALATHRAALDRRSEGVSLMKLAHVLLDQAEVEAARLLLDESIAVHREVSNRRAEGLALGARAAILAAQGKVDAANAAMGEASATFASIEDPNLAEVARIYGAHVASCAARSSGAPRTKTDRLPAITVSDEATTESAPPADSSEDVRTAMRTVIALRVVRSR